MEVTQLIRQIIERYDLNKDLDMKDHIYLVSPQFIEEKVKKIISLPGEIGFIARLGLLSGLREQELIYIKEKPICTNGYGCDCEKLHVVIAAIHKIMKRDVGIAYIAMRKYHYNVMRFRETVSVDEAEVLAGRFKSVNGRYYVLHDPESRRQRRLSLICCVCMSIDISIFGYKLINQQL
jgi:hypothetical protein